MLGSGSSAIKLAAGTAIVRYSSASRRGTLRAAQAVECCFALPEHKRFAIRAPSVIALRYTRPVPDVVTELLVAEAALEKLGARTISAKETEQLLRNEHVTVRNPRQGAEPDTRRLLIGRTDGGRSLTLVIEQTLDPTTWLIVTGWKATETERKILGS